MRFDSRKRKRWADESGVSEIVGNILILMITVTLFSTIIAFVQQMPMPEQQTKADFSAKLTFSSDGLSADLTLTHSGGDRLAAEKVLVFVTVDSVNYAFYLENDTDFTGTSWYTGVSWTKHLTGTHFTSKIEASVIDLSKQETVWSSQVSGGTGYSPPVIVERWVDSNPWTPTPDPVLAYQNFTLYVRIVDADNDLDSSTVRLDASQITWPSSMLPDGSPVDGVFKWSFNVWKDIIHPMGADQLDGAVLTIHAADYAGHQTNSAYVLSITILPITPIEYTYPGMDVGTGGLPPYLKNTSSRQGFGIYGENKTGGIARGTADTKDARTIFLKDEMVFIRFASLDMNQMLENVITLTDERSSVQYTPSYNLSSTASAPFYRFSSGGNVFIYEAKFSTSGLPPGLYNLGMSMENDPSASGGFTYPFTANVSLSIRQTGSTIWFEPSLTLYNTAARTTQWGMKSSPFEVSSSGSFKIYASLRVMDAQTSPAPNVEEVRIQDLTGVAQLYGKPVAGSMLSAWTPSGDLQSYNFEIDLRYANGAQWVGGTNSYTLVISRMSDSNEGLYSLTTQVIIRAFSARADFFVGTNGIAVGHANFDMKDYVIYIENNNFFTLNSLWGYTNTPSDRNTFTTTAMAAGDLNGDGFRDLLVAQDNSKALLYFKNSLETYGRWQDPSLLQRHTSDAANNIKWIAMGDINGDNALDFATVSTANKIVIYNNTYGMTPSLFLSSSLVIRKIDLKDMNGDGKADLVALVGGKIVIYNLAYWGRSTYPVLAKFPNTNNSWVGGSGILDFDIADMNLDGMLDILTVGDGATISVSPPFVTSGVWVNRYSAATNPKQTFLDETDSYYNIRVANGTKVSAGDVTVTEIADGSALQFAENSTGQSAGYVKVTMKTHTLELDQMQTLVVRARVQEGAEEAFYVWFSQDSDGNSDKFVPVIQIQATSSTFQYYSFPLPSSVAGKTIYVRFTDGTTTLGAVQDSIFIDYVAVVTGQFGGYSNNRTNVVVGAAAGWTCVRAAALDGPSSLKDVIAAKNGEWAAFDATNGWTKITLWSAPTAASTYVCSPDTLMANTAPTLFDVTDINGDGYDDVLVTNYTAVQSDITQLGFYMNMQDAKVWYRVAELGRTSGSGAITVSLAVNLSTREA